MLELMKLYEAAEEQNIPVLTFPLPGCGSVSVMDGDGCAIGMDKSVQDAGIQERVHLAHELGHCVTGSFYNI